MHVIRAILVIGLSLTTGCSTISRRPISGTEIDGERVSQIEPHKTTRADVDDWLGPPERLLQNQDGSEEARYRYAGFVDQKLEAIVYAKNVTEKEAKLLRLTLRDGVVTKVDFTNSLDPEQNVKR
jgi:hypothetical protein